ncbi:hypothetical protein [Streptomyces sp. NPDC020681]|uniref:hypothetical protein n=1 Tax=Streptomyces sp. NPDC020681 TaxID=3365083 RepID=UPI00378E2966
MPSAEYCHTRRTTGHPHSSRAHSGRHDAPPERQTGPRSRPCPTRGDGNAEGGRDQVHRPVTRRSAATMSSGVGGHPGT